MKKTIQTCFVVIVENYLLG